MTYSGVPFRKLKKRETKASWEIVFNVSEYSTSDTGFDPDYSGNAFPGTNKTGKKSKNIIPNVCISFNVSPSMTEIHWVASDGPTPIIRD